MGMVLLWFTRRRYAAAYAVAMTRVIVIGGGIQSGPAAGALVRDWLLHDEPRTIPAAARLAP